MTRDCWRCAGAGWVRLSVEVGGTTISAEASCPVCCAPSALALARWRQAHGWTANADPCASCGRPTHCHRDDGTPQHQHCPPTTGCAAQLELTWSN
jgi:hypothetical protein